MLRAPSHNPGVRLGNRSAIFHNEEGQALGVGIIVKSLTFTVSVGLVGLLSACAGGLLPAKPPTAESICAQYKDTAGNGPPFFVGTSITKGQDRNLNAAGYTGQCLAPDGPGIGLVGYVVLIVSDGSCVSLGNGPNGGCVGTIAEASSAVDHSGRKDLIIIKAVRNSTTCAANECVNSKL
jgi:hypothetical protein